MHMTNPSSRVQSRVNSRAASPTASIRSRRSRVSRRTNREDDASDEEEEDRKPSLRRASIRSDRRKLSQASETFQEPPPPEKRPISPALSTRGASSRDRQERNVTLNRQTSDQIEKKYLQQNADKMSDVQSIIKETQFRISPDRISERGMENQKEMVEIEIEIDKLDAPPPPTPQHSWLCEYCTFENAAGVRVCEVCCKTPTAPPIPSSLPAEVNSSMKGNKISSSESCVYDYSDAENYTLSKKQNSVAKRAPKASPESDSNDESMSYVSKRGRLKKISFLPGTK